MTRAVVLGAGMVGSVMAADLAGDGDIEVAIADVSTDALERAARRAPGVTTIQADLGDPAALRRAIAPYDLVLGALPSAIGFQSLRAVLEGGKPYCDICFMPEAALSLDGLARERGVTAVVDCGVAPGMSNMLAGRAAHWLDPCTRIAIYVGGIPRRPEWPFRYKAAFSPHDVIEEYTRPARMVEGGAIVEREALGNVEPIEFPGVGTLEAFDTDGLRSLLETLEVPDMTEKTMRHPGHVELMRVFKATGLFSDEPIKVGGATVRPRDVTSALLFPKWTYEPGEEDLTVMRVIAEGRRDGKPARIAWDMIDRYDAATRTTSMARTTAFPCTIVARLIAEGAIDRTGVIPPELIGRDTRLTDRVLEALEQRGVVFSRTDDGCHATP